MKIIKIVLITFSIIFSLVYALDLEYFVKGIRVVYMNGQSTVFIDDLNYFDFETIKSTSKKSPWVESKNKVISFTKDFEDYNIEMGTAAYLVIHKDTIIAEKY